MFGFHQGYPFAETVIVNTKTKLAFRGVLWSQKGTYLVLRNAELLKGKGEAAVIDGEVLIDRTNIDFMQVIARGVL